MKTFSTPTVIRHLRDLTGRPGDAADDQLLRRYLAGRDEEAFAALVRRHGPMVLAVCRRVLRREQDAEDAFQATFVVLARRAAAVRPDCSLAAWLHGVARRVALKARASRRAFAPLGEFTAADADPSWREVMAVLDEELTRLPAKLRAPLVLYYLEGLKREEAAARLGCPLGTVKGRLERGRDLLRKRLTRRGLALSVALTTLAVGHATLPRALAAAAVASAIGRDIPERVLALARAASPSAAVAAVKVGAAVLLIAGAVLVGAAAFFPQQQELPAPPANPVNQARPKEAAKPRLDVLGDPVPDGAVARLGSARLYHGDTVYRVTLSPDAKLVVSTGAQGVNKLWDAVTGKELPLAEADRHAFVFAAAGKLLAVGRQPADTRIRDLATGQTVGPDGIDLAAERQRAEPGDKEHASPDGKVYATIQASRDGQRVVLWDAATRQELPPLEDRQAQDSLSFVAFSPDGKLVAAPFREPTPSVRVWDLATRKVVARLPAQGSQIFHTSFSADNKVLAAGDSHGITLWDVKTGRWLHDFGHTYFVGSLAFTPDGKTLITGANYTDKVIRLWDPLTGKERGQWLGHTLGLEGLAVHPDGKQAVTASQDQTLRLWDVETGKSQVVGRLGEANQNIWSVGLSRDGRILATARNKVRLWDIPGRKEIRSLGAVDGSGNQLAFSPDGKRLAVTESGLPAVRVWDVETGQERRLFVAQDTISGRPAFSPDGALLAAGQNDGMIRLWEVLTGRELRTFGEPVKPDPNPTHAPCSLAFAPDGRTLAAGYSNLDVGVRLWEVASGQERARFRDGHRSGVASLAFSPDGSLLVSGGWDRIAVVWDVTGRHTGQPRSPLGAEGLRTCWDELAGHDATRAYQAVLALTASGRPAVAFLTERLRPAAAVETKVVERWVKDLDSDDFATRERSSMALLELGEPAEAHLRKTLDGDLTAETRRRVERVLSHLDPVNAPERLRGPRAVEALEGIGTSEAKQLIQKLAEGDPTARLTRDAKAALRRTAERP